VNRADSLAFYGAIFPKTTFLLFFVLPMPAWALIGGMFAYDAYSAVTNPGSGTDSAGHVGGIVAGLAAAAWARRRGLGGRFGRFM
jgi:rhomboid-like protein